MSTFDRLADLPVEIDGYTLEGLRAQVSSGFERLTTVVHLHGGGAEGVGEDVIYDAEDHVALQEAGPVLPLAGRYDARRVLRALDGLDLFPVAPPAREVSRLYRRWTFTVAALDLALRQAGRPLHAALGREPQPRALRRLAAPRRAADARRRRAPAGALPGAALQARPDQLVDARADRRAGRATGAVDSVDFKGLYLGTIVDQPPDPVLYERVVARLPGRLDRGPRRRDARDRARSSADHHDRITWDAPIHSIADIEALPFAPRMVNIKPSRIGGLHNAAATPTTTARSTASAPTAAASSSSAPGRGQTQYLASLFHADAPNDVAPTGYNQNDPPPGLPGQPAAAGRRADRLSLGPIETAGALGMRRLRSQGPV